MYEKVIFPNAFDPKTSPIYALNDIDVAAPSEVVWNLLVDALNWANYFPYEDNVEITSGEAELGPKTTFHRVTVGFPMSLTITEFEPFRRLAWSTIVDQDPSATAYHGWVITPTPGGCHLLTEETQQGEFFIEEIARKRPGGLYAYHQEWVERLARAAEERAAGGN